MKLKVNNFSRGFLLLLALGLCNFAIAQRTITGTVTDSETGEPLIGANILVVGTSTGTVTDFDGTFSLDVPQSAAELEVSYTGYGSQRVAIGTQNTINVQLSPGELLEEVVVVGYGTVRKEDATGAVVALSEDEFNQGVIASPEQLLQGRAAGVQITQSSGEPGAGLNIRIRGTSSVRSNNNPLFVVDGVPLEGGATSAGGNNYGAGASSARNPLNFLNPDDIESISVLKDASAAAIYGSRGANGVILITTKRGRAGQSNLSFSTSGSISNVARTYDLVPASDYVDLAVAAGANADIVDYGGSTDWQDVIFRTAYSQSHSLSYGGGNDQTRYRFSLGYLDQQGVVEQSSLRRLNGRINASHGFLNDRVELSLQLTASRVLDQYPAIGEDVGYEGNLIGAALQANPTIPVYAADGSLVQRNDLVGGAAVSNDFRNPRALIDLIDDGAATSRVLGSITARWNITDALNYQFQLGLDNAESVRNTAVSPLLGFNDVEGIGRAIINNRYNSSELYEHTLNLNTDLGNNRLDAVVGFSYQQFNNRGTFLEARFLPDLTGTDLELIDLIDFANNSGSNRAYTAGSDRSQEELQSYFGRINYNIGDRFLLTGTVRADGSTKFGENNKYGVFPSFAAAWRLAEEAFVPEVFYDLKLRAGWGVTGNQEFDGGATRPIYRFDPANNSLSQVNVANPDLQWEETTQLNVGVDFGFAGGRLLGSVDYYNKVTDNLIFLRDYAQPAPAERQWVNLPGEVTNSGVEISLDGRIVDRPTFGWQVLYNMTFNKNEVSGLGTFVNTGAINGQGLSGAYAQRIADGQPLFSFYMREFEGFDSEGLGLYANNEQLAFVGDPFPDFTFGLTNNFNFGNFDLGIFLQGVYGFELYNNTANAIFLKGNLRNGRNVSVDAANSPENAANFGEASTRFLEKGDFLRLQNATLGYTFPVGGTSAIRSLRLFLTGQNLFLITDYTGFDPEVNTNKAINGVPSLGIDYTSYPTARTFTLGLNAGF